MRSELLHTILCTITGAVLHDEFAHDADGQSQDALYGLVQRLIILRCRPGVAIMRTVVTNPVPAHVAQAECVVERGARRVHRRALCGYAAHGNSRDAACTVRACKHFEQLNTLTFEQPVEILPTLISAGHAARG